MARKLITLIES
ncbi:hypothetical protein Zm00014a_018498 [Zea mays]|uniref:Uncharacterized protein n=1 Tax=Zea mays TaxID=4577 RepID=A0A3L6E4P1_MAIZE|nr:hypothetical protein Zm00014a_018498 [Zea mays]